MTGSLCSRQEMLFPASSFLHLNAFLLTPSLPVFRICTHIHLEATQAYLGKKISFFFPGVFCAFQIMILPTPTIRLKLMLERMQTLIVCSPLQQGSTSSLPRSRHCPKWQGSKPNRPTHWPWKYRYATLRWFIRYWSWHDLTGCGRIRWHRGWDLFLELNEYPH